MSFFVFIKTGLAQAKRLQIGILDALIPPGQFLTILNKNVGISPSKTTHSLTLTQHDTGVGKHIMLTVENGRLVSYLVDSNLPGAAGDDKVKKFDGGDVNDSDSGITWVLTAGNGTLTPSTPKTWPFLLFDRLDIS